MPNFIPAGEDNSAAKRPGGHYGRNFVPAEGFVEKPRMTEDEQFEAATTARHRARLRAQEVAWSDATTRLIRSTASHAAEIIRAAPSAIREMYLLAEESTQNRSAVLGLFPPAGPTARATWAGYAEPQQEADAVADTAPPEGEVFMTSSVDVPEPVKAKAPAKPRANKGK